ncbi:hypothetical protein H4R35_001853 [Dimargaris xerosporica]|nr:hypothetical protein H4R35_001853 [Dimargaris xerosporica]
MVESFTLFDKDNDGFITLAELEQALCSAGEDRSNKELREMINKVDADGDGRVDFNEFAVMMASTNSNSPSGAANDLRDAFKAFDLNGDGYISKEELKSAMAQLGEKLPDYEIDEMIHEADKNGDGKIDYEEFIKMMPNMA